ncbi:MAG TPA: hypothetical protein VLX64_05990 [Thermoplasmata archaeon]|nr:hypothetical protein [Thermoplasmata archaeon]
MATRAPTVTYVTPPRLASFPAERAALEYSSRSIVFADDGGALLRAWGPPEAPYVLRVEEAGARWRVSAWGADAPGARAAARAMFSLDHPIEAFYALARGEPILRRTPAAFRGLRLPRDANVFESLVHAVVGQQLSVAAASAMHARLTDAAGARLSAGGIEVPRTPTPGEIRALGPAGLKATGLSRAKSSALLALADRYRARAFEGAWLADGPSEAAIARLDAEPGVGRWTAENALLRGTGRTDLFVAGDLGIRVALDRFGAVPRDAPEAAARAWADRWYPGWGSYATLYLWRRLVADRQRVRGAVVREG